MQLACSVVDRSIALHYHASVLVSVTTYSATLPVVTGSCNHPIVFLYSAVDLKYAPTLPRKWLRCICRYIMDREWLLQVLLLLKTGMTTRRSLVVRLSLPPFSSTLHSEGLCKVLVRGEFRVHTRCTHTRRVRSDELSGAPGS